MQENLPGGQTGWRMGNLEVDTTLAKVTLHGNLVALDRSGYDLLLHLLEHAGSVVSKDDLLKIGWRGRIVAENTLAKAISKLRHAIGDEEGTLIRVVHGYGYRLAGHAIPVFVPVTVALTEPRHAALSNEVAPTRRHGWLLVAMSLLLVVSAFSAWGWRERQPIPANTPIAIRATAPGEDVIAVLPFRDLSTGGSLGLLADGFASHLRTRLLGMPNLRHVGPGESEGHRDDRRDVAAIARDLRVNLVVSGDISRHADRLRVDVRLFDAKHRIPPLHRIFERSADDQATLLDDITSVVIDAIGNQPGRWQHDPASGHGTTNRDAYLAFLRASTLFAGNNDPNSQRRAIAIMEQAVALDPGYADAWLVLGGTLGGSGYYADSAQELVAGRSRALATMDHGIALMPTEAANYLLRSEMRLLYRFDWNGAMADIDAAAARTPGGESAMLLIWRARVAASRGHLDEAIALDARAIARDPKSGARRNQGWHYLAKGDTRNARSILMLQLEDLPENPHTNFYLALCDIYEHRPDAALQRLEHSSTLFRLLGTTIAQHELGNHAASDRALKKLTDQYAIADGYWVGAAHAWRGERDQAFEWLDRAMRGGDSSVLYLAFDPLLQNLRGDPRYAELVARLRIPDGTTSKVQVPARVAGQ